MGKTGYVKPALGSAGKTWGWDTRIHLSIGAGGQQGTSHIDLKEEIKARQGVC